MEWTAYALFIVPLILFFMFACILFAWLYYVLMEDIYDFRSKINKARKGWEEDE